ncbi:hypothetical protein BdWA1_003460 [Babesia duncani]|uniref:Uncharacterized protein n=1 Tax=Babesia duncani TaxID=323732 RepID=A0AAD9UML6_9APIC|nr:hypothetical protein BdWA1_003460 [Babesia duncani]
MKFIATGILPCTRKYSNIALAQTLGHEHCNIASNDDKSDTYLPVSDQEVFKRVPDLNSKTFKDHMLIPQLGWRALFSNEMIKYKTGSALLYKEYVQGSTAAHHYPMSIIPRKFSARIPGDIYVSAYALDNFNYHLVDGKLVRMSIAPSVNAQGQVPLLHSIYGDITIVIIFSGQPPHSDSAAAMSWKRAIEDDHNVLMTLYNPHSIGLKWIHNRYVNAVAAGIVESTKFVSVNSRLTVDTTIDLHQYRKELPSVLVVDKAGYIRWHAIGTVTKESLALLKYCLEKLSYE